MIQGVESRFSLYLEASRTAFLCEEKLIVRNSKFLKAFSENYLYEKSLAPMIFSIDQRLIRRICMLLIMIFFIKRSF